MIIEERAELLAQQTNKQTETAAIEISLKQMTKRTQKPQQPTNSKKQNTI